jgi:hypothetical protein
MNRPGETYVRTYALRQRTIAATTSDAAIPRRVIASHDILGASISAWLRSGQAGLAVAASRLGLDMGSIPAVRSSMGAVITQACL